MHLQTLSISKKAFWDVDFASLEAEKNSLFIIQRIFEYGLWDEIWAIIRFYGEKRVAQEIVKASWLSQKTIAFCCVLLELKPQNFKCYTKKLSNQEHWNY